MAQTATTKQTVISSAAFKSGFNTGLSNKQCIGWNINGVPTEDTVLAVMRTLASLTSEDRNDTYAMLWVAGLIAGWFKREGI
jgi:hypothetical protein